MSKHDELRTQWNNFATSFQKHFEPCTASTAYSMLSMLNLHNAKNVLELGCGAGLAGTLAARFMSPGSKLSMIDLSKKMIDLAKERMKGN